MTEQTLTRQAALNKASAAASATLKARHISEWNILMASEAEALGQKWSPKMTAEQRAEATIRALLEANPNLKATFADEEKAAEQAE